VWKKVVVNLDDSRSTPLSVPRPYPPRYLREELNNSKVYSILLENLVPGYSGTIQETSPRMLRHLETNLHCCISANEFDIFF
jgi:hypothetical protein